MTGSSVGIDVGGTFTDGARTTTSVKVPPTSMPTLLPVMRERLARDASQ